MIKSKLVNPEANWENLFEIFSYIVENPKREKEEEERKIKWNGSTEKKKWWKNELRNKEIRVFFLLSSLMPPILVLYFTFFPSFPFFSSRWVFTVGHHTWYSINEKKVRQRTDSFQAFCFNIKMVFVRNPVGVVVPEPGLLPRLLPPVPQGQAGRQDMDRYVVLSTTFGWHYVKEFCPRILNQINLGNVRYKQNKIWSWLWNYSVDSIL